MDDKERIERLENVLAQMLKPIQGVPFSIVIRSLCKKKIIKIDANSKADQKLIKMIEEAAKKCADEMKRKPIKRPRPNEVGNDIEDYVMRALSAVGLHPERPAAANGRRQSTGYPDILIYDESSRPTYLECKIYAFGVEPTTMRSFYLSPSEMPKVSMDARHLLLAFGVESSPIDGDRNSNYRAKSFKLVDLHDLLCNVKYEFNSNNRELYAPNLLLSEGTF